MDNDIESFTDKEHLKIIVYLVIFLSIGLILFSLITGILIASGVA